MLANNNKTLLQNEKKNENVYLADCVIQIKDLHDKLLKEKTNYMVLESKYNILDKKHIELQIDFDKIKKENKYLNIKVDDLYLTLKYHNKDSLTMEDISKKVKEEMNKFYTNKNINIKETQEYIELKKINEKYNKKIIDLEYNLEKINSNIEYSILFKNIKEQNNILKINYEKLELDNIEIKQEIYNQISSNKEKEDISSKTNLNKNENLLYDKKEEIKINIKEPILENKNINDTNITDDDKKIDSCCQKNNKYYEIITENINKIIKKLDKLYEKDFTDEQITINKSLINFYSKIYDLIKDKDEKNDAQYINEILDSSSTDTNRFRFKKILKVANFINNHTFLKRSSIVIPLYMFKGIPINSMDILFDTITDYFKDFIIDDDSTDNNGSN